MTIHQLFGNASCELAIGEMMAYLTASERGDTYTHMIKLEASTFNTSKHNKICKNHHYLINRKYQEDDFVGCDINGERNSATETLT